jgi:HEXXH motif-containing protein
VDPPRDITLPEPGSTTARRVLGESLRRTLSDLMRMPLGRFRSHVFDDFSDIRAVLESLIRERQLGLVLSVLRRPTHATLIRCLQSELWGQGDVGKLDAWLTELSALTAFELAACGALPPEGLRLRQRPARLLSIPQNAELVIDARYRLGFRPGQLVLQNGGESVTLELDALDAARLPEGVSLSRPYFTIADAIQLACADNNPLSDIEAHPDKSGNRIDLGEQPPELWVKTLRDALELVDRYLPELGAEIRLVMQALVPVGYDPARHLSASYAEAIGVAYLTLHPDLMTMTEALIHEFSHNKLNALWNQAPVLENAFAPLYSSPVRPDPRPLHGVLLAVHAFVPVARLYEHMLQERDPLAEHSGFSNRFHEIVKGNHEGTETLLEHARPTPSGQSVLDELERWDRHFASARAEGA